MNILVQIQKIVLILSFFLIHTLYSFDVKVLLKKYNLNFKNNDSIRLNAQDGFILSYNPIFSIGCKYPQKTLKIISKDDRVFVNGKVLDKNILYITPMLSRAIELEIKSRVSYWLESSLQEELFATKNLESIFDDMISSSDPLSDKNCTVLIDYIKTAFDLYFIDISLKYKNIETFLDPIKKYTNEYLQVQFKKIFSDILESKHIRPEYRKVLIKDQKKRFVFLSEQLHRALGKLLIDFIYALPRKIIQNMVDQKISMIDYEDQKYLGSFILFQDKKQIFIINSLDINDYLLSVVRYEGFPGWPVEMNKVTAIACRTYLVYQVLQAQKTDRSYHIENKNNHQTYKGYHDSPKIRQAVEETKDLIIGFNGNPICSMYDICCGGVVPGSIDDPDHKKLSYLARTYPCTFCKSYKPFSWYLEFSSEDVLHRLKKEFAKIENIDDIYVYKKDKAGLVKKIIIISGKEKLIITDKKMKSLFPEIKSVCFDIGKNHKKYTLEGKGFGHHKGLCQWGACHLVRQEHWNFEEVLQFYYPGTNLMKLSY